MSQFIEKTLEHLKAKGIKIDDIQEFTNQCANQYKSKNNFYTISKSKIPVTRHFFAIKHGKGPSDHAGAHYKNWVKCIMRDPHLFITSCRDLAEYSILHYSKQVKCNGENAKDAHSLRFVIYHPEIYWMESKGKNLKTIKNTQKIHSIRNTGVEGVLEKLKHFMLLQCLYAWNWRVPIQGLC